MPPPIVISVDHRGRVSSVDISTTWRSTLAPEGFADALFAAYTDALHQVAPPRSAPLPASPAPVRTDGDTETWLRRVADWSAAMDERLAALRAAPPEEREVRGPSGYVTLRLRGPAVVGMTANVAALRTANPTTLRQDVLDAFDAAQPD